LVVDSGVKHQNTRGDFNQRVAACRAGVAFLRSSFAGITHLRDVQNVGWDELEPLLPEVITLSQLHEQGLEIGDIPGLPTQAPLRVRACCRHVWSENRRVLQAFDAMKAGAIQDLGELLTQAHASVRDDYTVSCRELEILVAAASEVDGVIGARLTGAGWGGCIVAVVHEEAVGEFNQHVGPVYQRLTGRQPSIFPCTAGAGAGMVVDWGR
jgi:galactokinase